MIWMKLIWRDLRFHWVLWGLSLLGIVVGVAGWVGMEAATSRASSAFRESMNMTLGTATHVVEDRLGPLEERTYFKLEMNYSGQITPVLETYGRLNHRNQSNPPTGSYVRVLGIDPLSYASFQEEFQQSSFPFQKFLSGRNVALVSADFRDRLSKGDRLSIQSEGRSVSVKIVGFMSDSSIRRTVFADVGWVQDHVMDQPVLSRILIQEGEEPVDRLRDFLGETEFLLPRGTRTRSVRSMVNAFEWNLRALSYLSLFVGGFLVYSTMYLYASRHSRIISLLKTVGAGRNVIFRFMFGALALLGLVGSFVGVAVGSLFSVPVRDLVQRTIDQLYVPLFSSGGALSTESLIRGFVLGIVMSVVGGFKPIWDQVSIPPRSWERRRRTGELSFNSVLSLFSAGIGGWAVAWILVNVSSSITTGFLACFLIAFGGSLMSPMVLFGVSYLVPNGNWFRMTGRNLRYYISRTGVMVAVLVAAFSMVLAVSLMVDSFRQSVNQWIQNVIKADYYVRSAPGSSNRIRPSLNEDFLNELRSLEGIREVGLLAEKTVLTKDGNPLTVRGIQPDVLRKHLEYQFNEIHSEPWSGLKSGKIWLSEPGSYRLDKNAGDQILLPSESRKNVPFEIAAVYNDYSTEWAVAYVSLDRMNQLFGNVSITGAALFTGEELRTSSLQLLTDRHNYYLEAQEGLKKRAMNEFDRTFTVTDVMKIVAALVAGIGLLILLISFSRFRSWIFGRLSAIGSSRNQLLSMIVGESFLIALTAFLVSIPTGVFLSHVLINVINRESFGWLIPFQIHSGPFLGLGGLIVLTLSVSLLAPLHQLWTTPLVEFLREQRE